MGSSIWEVLLMVLSCLMADRRRVKVDILVGASSLASGVLTPGIMFFFFIAVGRQLPILNIKSHNLFSIKKKIEKKKNWGGGGDKIKDKIYFYCITVFPFKFEISNFEIYINSFTLEFNLPKYLASVFDLNFDPFHWSQYCYTISNFNQHKLERNDCGWHFWTFSGSVREVIVIFLLSTVKFYLLFLGELVLRIVCFWGSPVGVPGWAPSKHCSLYRSACALPPCLALWHSVKMFKVSHHENRINLGYKTLYGNLIINLTNQNTFSSFLKQIVKKQVTYK